jgi:hypothetical protein
MSIAGEGSVERPFLVSNMPAKSRGRDIPAQLMCPRLARCYS